ncbi:nuclear pore complex protein Nup133 [Cydia strobilella]|uniref:nuclear pore complex protein Nup133 n=1 Tax=Cydia strobilella TaxID=1100964 RepID=UPI00300554BA
MDFPNTSGIRSPFSPRVRQSITGRRAGLTSAKKNQSKFMQSTEAPTGEVIYKTPLTTVETYGHPLPVLVTEALTFASGEVTVGLSANGYCWLVFGRRLLVWARDGGAARELTLPQTDLQHKAELVEVFYEDGAQMPSCIGVSPEGVVRYWPSVGQELYVDTSCELAGQECSRLVASGSASGLLLATTSCSLLQLRPEPERPGVTCKQLRPPSGWLGGIGRRVSLLFFGSMPANADTKLVGVVILHDGPMSAGVEEPGYVALVGGGGGAVLQLWRGADLHEHNLRRALTDAHRAQGDVNSLQVMCLDVRAGGPRWLALLIACVNVARADTRHAIAHMSVEDPANPRVTSLIPLRGCTLSPDIAPRLLPLPSAAALYTSTYVAIVSEYIVYQCTRPGQPPNQANPRVTSLIPLRGCTLSPDIAPRLLPLPSAAALYTSTYVAIVSTVANDKVEYIDVASEGDRILGATLCNGQPLLFSRKHGVLALTSAETVSTNVSVCESPMGSPCPSDMYDGNLSLYEIDPHEVSMVTTDACGKLKTAFLFHLRRDTAACRAIVHDLFPAKQRSDPALDNTVVRIATELCDDIPQGDPRWKQRAGGPSTNIPLGSSSALQITAQLRDKQRAFSLFADFLRATGLWQRLGSLETGGDCVSTVSALGMLAEKLAIALALRKKQHSGDSQLIDAAVYQVVCGDEAEPEEPEVEAALSSGALSPADVCFRRVSSIQRVLVALCSVCAPAQHDVRALATHAEHVSRLLTSILTEVHGTRVQWQPRPLLPPLGSGALLPRLVQLHTRAVSQYGPGCPDVVLRSSLYEATSLLADLILTEAEPLRQHGDTRHVGERMRRDIIQPYGCGATSYSPTVSLVYEANSLLANLILTEAEPLRQHGDTRHVGERMRRDIIQPYGCGATSYSPTVSLVYEANSLLANLILTEAEPLRQHGDTRHVGERMRRDIIQPYGCGATSYSPTVSLVYEANSLLANLILTEAEPLRQHGDTRHVGERMRRDIIQPYVDAGQMERAAVLAEKFKDFELLIELCDRQDDMERLYSYIDKYSGEGIAESAFAHLLGAGGGGAARLVRALGARYPARLHAWLARTPARDPVRALHHLHARDYGQAGRVLAGLARGERDAVNRMTTTASLAKLCLLASDEEPQPSDLWNKVEGCLSLAEQHAALPRDIKLLHGLDAADCRVMPPEELIQMYIESESDALTEYDYKKALDLTDFVQDMERRDDLRLRVWCACIRRSPWDAVDVEAPAAELQDKMFFRLMHLVHFMGGDLELLLPPAEDILTARELAELVSDARFRYIVKYGYECLHARRQPARDLSLTPTPAPTATPGTGDRGTTIIPT